MFIRTPSLSFCKIFTKDQLYTWINLWGAVQSVHNNRENEVDMTVCGQVCSNNILQGQDYSFDEVRAPLYLSMTVQESENLLDHVSQSCFFHGKGLEDGYAANCLPVIVFMT